MCGLFGVCANNQNIQKDRASKARDVLYRRGPDQSGEWSDKTVYMGHRRLSILDLSETGRQPMVSEDAQIIILVNGEIYNFKTLREELEFKGACFKSGSDSEVVLHGYRHWGIYTLLEKIDGMYAICIYDKEKGEILLARDRPGVKPLYYAHLGGMFLWASEIQPIKTYIGDRNLETDNTALYDFLTYSYIPSPKTPYKNVHKLPPAHLLRYNIQSSSVALERYWSLNGETISTTDDDAIKKLQSLMAQSVEEQIVSDVPVGCFLSGGVDSSIITGLAASYLGNVKTFTIGFGVSGHDETQYAEDVAKYFKTDHRSTIITPELDVPFDQWLLNLYGEPLSSNSALPTWHVSLQAKKDVSVVLSGDGGDELFGGYKWYRRDKIKIILFKLLSYIPLWFWKLPLPRKTGLMHYAECLRGVSDPLEIYNSLYFTKISKKKRNSYKKTFNIPDDYDDMWFYRPYYKPELGTKKWRQYLDFHAFMPEMVLTKVDRATMAHSLEARVPFLSRAVTEFAFSLPERFLYKNGKLKGGLKLAFADLLPLVVLSREKQGFSLPWTAWKKDLINKEGNLQEALLKRFKNQGA